MAPMSESMPVQSDQSDPRHEPTAGPTEIPRCPVCASPLDTAAAGRTLHADCASCERVEGRLARAASRDAARHPWTGSRRTVGSSRTRNPTRQAASARPRKSRELRGESPQLSDAEVAAGALMASAWAGPIAAAGFVGVKNLPRKFSRVTHQKTPELADFCS